jgi:hypothetical protein
MDEVTGGWRKLRNEEPHYFNSLSYIRIMKSGMLRWVERVTRVWEMRNVYSILVGKPERKGLFRKYRLRWEGGIKMELKHKGWKDVDSCGLGYGLMVSSCEHDCEPSGSIKNRKFL